MNDGVNYMKLINRVIYMNEIKELAGTPDIKVITGVRRCGKSKLMDAFAEYLKTSDESANIIHINGEKLPSSIQALFAAVQDEDVRHTALSYATGY